MFTMEKFPSLEKFYTNAVGGVGDNYEVCVLLVLLVGIELVSSSTRVTSVKSATRCWREKVRDNRTHRSDQGYLGPIKIMHVL